MRVLLDTNVFISYLLRNAPGSPITSIVAAAVRGRYTLLLSDSILYEFEERVRGKSYLRTRISPDDMALLTSLLRQAAEIIPPLDWIPRVCRDRKDDFLLAYAAVGQADYLVTGDEDLLVLEKVQGIRIITPRQFTEVLRRQ